MTHYEMVEKLREKADVTYEEAKSALELTDWDLLDAMLLLERRGQTKQGARTEEEFSTQRIKRTSKEFNIDEEINSAKSFFSRVWSGIREAMGEGGKRTLHIHRHGRTILEVSLTMAVIIGILALLTFDSFAFLFIAWIISLLSGVRYEVINRPPVAKKDKDERNDWL